MQRVIHSVLTARILLNLRQAVKASEQMTSQDDKTLSWEVASSNRRRRSSHSESEMGTRTRTRHERQSIIGRYLSMIYNAALATLDLDPETWTHDEVRGGLRLEMGNISG